MKAGDEWRFLRVTLILLLVSTLIYVTVADYPTMYSDSTKYAPLWLALLGHECSTGWIHEVAYIVVLFWILVQGTFSLEARQLGISKVRSYRKGGKRNV